MNGIYVELPRRGWVRIKGRLGGIASPRKVVQTLIAESMDGEPVVKDKPRSSFYISSTSVTKYIYRLLDKELHKDSLIIIRFVNTETYKVEVYSGKASEARKIAEEMNIVKARKTKRGAEQ